jgi:hypothetical protein
MWQAIGTASVAGIGGVVALRAGLPLRHRFTAARLQRTPSPLRPRDHAAFSSVVSRSRKKEIGQAERECRCLR